MQDQIAEIICFIKGTLKYKAVAIIIAWLVCLIGWTFIILIPNKYISEASVHIDTKNMLNPLLRGLAVTSDERSMSSLVGIMKQLMFTRPNLEKIVDLSNLDVMDKSNIEQNALFEKLKKSIQIQGGKKSDLYEVSYEAMSAELAQSVVIAVLTVFSEQTQQSNIDDLNISHRFVESQINEYEIRLRNAEKAREIFKRTNFGMLPGSDQGQLSRLQSINDQVENTRLLLRGSISKRDVLAGQMQEVLNTGDTWKLESSSSVLSAEDEKIKQLQARKIDLLLKYTENHPEVVAIENTLRASLKKKENTKVAAPDNSLAGILANPYVQQLKISLNQAETDVAAYKATIQLLVERSEKLKQELNVRLSVETEMQNLNRDYETIKANYEQFVNRREQISISEKVDHETETIKFKIVDPPTKPLLPSKPNRLLLISVVFIAAFALGFGGAFLMYFIRPFVMSAQQLRELSGLPVLGVVSLGQQDGVKIRKQIYPFLFALMGLFLCYAGVFVYSFQITQQINS